jgi:hypothetical protein
MRSPSYVATCSAVHTFLGGVILLYSRVSIYPRAFTGRCSSTFLCAHSRRQQNTHCCTLRASFQHVRYTRLLQVANKSEGSLLGDVLADPERGMAAVDPASLSETIVFTILTTADDAKGDNFMVGADGVITGVDNDHVLGAPFVQANWLKSLDTVFKDEKCAKSGE